MMSRGHGGGRRSRATCQTVPRRVAPGHPPPGATAAAHAGTEDRAADQHRQRSEPTHQDRTCTTSPMPNQATRSGLRARGVMRLANGRAGSSAWNKASRDAMAIPSSTTTTAATQPTAMGSVPRPTSAQGPSPTLSTVTRLEAWAGAKLAPPGCGTQGHRGRSAPFPVQTRRRRGRPGPTPCRTPVASGARVPPLRSAQVTILGAGGPRRRAAQTDGVAKRRARDGERRRFSCIRWQAGRSTGPVCRPRPTLRRAPS